MNQPDEINYWQEVEGGFRGSVMLRLGALLMAAGALGNLATRLLAGPSGPSQGLTIGSWVPYIVGLWLVGSAFVWIGAGPHLTRFGFVVGGVHILNGVQFLVLLFTTNALALAIPPASLTIARLGTLVVFALVEKKWLLVRTRQILGAVAGAQLLKVLSLELLGLPSLGHVGGPLLDATLLLGMAAILLHLGAEVREKEDALARALYEDSRSDFSDFNNPEHHWNKKKTSGRKHSRHSKA